MNNFKTKIQKVLLWIKDHFHLLVSVIFRLNIGAHEKKENPDSHKED